MSEGEELIVFQRLRHDSFVSCPNIEHHVVRLTWCEAQAEFEIWGVLDFHVAVRYVNMR